MMAVIDDCDISIENSHVEYCSLFEVLCLIEAWA